MRKPQPLGRSISAWRPCFQVLGGGRRGEAVSSHMPVILKCSTEQCILPSNGRFSYCLKILKYIFYIFYIRNSLFKRRICFIWSG